MDKFIGNIDAKADAKGRVFVPATFRKTLQAAGESSLILRKDDRQNCLVLYPKNLWEKELELIREKLNKWNKEQQNLFRYISSQVEMLDMDANGRILIPKKYLQMANITHEVHFLGMSDNIELWNPAQLKKSLLSQEESEKSIDQFLADL
jgi:MraZ protein